MAYLASRPEFRWSTNLIDWLVGEDNDCMRLEVQVQPFRSDHERLDHFLQLCISDLNFMEDSAYIIYRFLQRTMSDEHQVDCLRRDHKIQE